MGWYYHPYWNRKETIENEIAVNVCRIHPYGALVEYKTIKSCYRGSSFAGTLWAVHEWINWKTGKTDRWIGCYLMHYKGGEWGYKPMEESMGPYVYNCPLSYLRMVPIPAYGYGRKWRMGVSEYHYNKQKRKELVTT